MRNLIIFVIAAIILTSCEKNSDVMPNNGNTGQGGSMARFTIAMDHLYVVDDRNLYAYSLADASRPQLKGTVNIGFDIETIYAFEDKLFIGSNDAMYIYSITDPAKPEQLSIASHARACDPVIADDNVAYVTVRSTGSCGGDINALYVYDVRDLKNPKRLNTIEMEGPWGLGMKDKTLFVCNGSYGMNVYDITVPGLPVLKHKLADETYFDVIATNNLLICMIEGGMALYGYGGENGLTLKAKIMD